MLAKALAGVFTVFIATTAGVAGAGYLQIQPPEVPKGAPPAPPPIEIKEEELPEVEPGGPRTLLVLGSDRRAKNSTDAKLYGQAEQPHSDTIVLVRLDPKRNRIAVHVAPARPRGDDPRLRRQHEDQPGLRRGRRAARRWTR